MESYFSVFILSTRVISLDEINMISACNDILAGYSQFLGELIFLYFDENLDENLAEILIQIVLGEFLAAEILRSRRDPGENLASIWPVRFQDLGEISARSQRESRRVFGWRDLEISPRSRRDLEISPAKNSPRSRSKFCRGV